MKKNKSVQFGTKIAKKWWFSVVDVIEILTEQSTHDHARKYWSVMKTRLKKEGAKAAKAAREQIEKSTGKPAVSKLNARNLGRIALNG